MIDKSSLNDNGKDLTLALIIGASEFPYDDATSNSSFSRSSDQVYQYLKNEEGLNLSSDKILNLFDDKRNVIDQSEDFIDFINSNKSANQIIIYYVGHGGFLSDNEYYLMVYATKKNNRSQSALRIKDLAHVLDMHFPKKKIFLILDCCFAAAAVKDFQFTDFSRVVNNQTYKSFPSQGTSMLLASSKDDPAVAPKNMKYTMFTDCLLRVLKKGVVNGPEWLSLEDVKDGVRHCIQSFHGQKGVIPEVHSPRQCSGDAAKLPLFPNHAFTPPPREKIPKELLKDLNNPLPQIRITSLDVIFKYSIDYESEDLLHNAYNIINHVYDTDDSDKVKRHAKEILSEILSRLNVIDGLIDNKKDWDNLEGFDKEGFDKEGFDKEGFGKEGFDKAGFDQAGFDQAGFDKEGFDKEGFDKEGFDKEGFGKEGFDKEGFDKEGFDKEGFGQAGFDQEGFDQEGFDKEGFGKEGFGKEGFDKEGFDKEGFDKEGFGKEGFDKEGFDKEGFDQAGFDKEGFDKEGFDQEGFDKEGFDKEGFDQAGFNRSGDGREGKNLNWFRELLKKIISLKSYFISFIILCIFIMLIFITYMMYSIIHIKNELEKGIQVKVPKSTVELINKKVATKEAEAKAKAAQEAVHEAEVVQETADKAKADAIAKAAAIEAELQAKARATAEQAAARATAEQAAAESARAEAAAKRARAEAAAERARAEAAAERARAEKEAADRALAIAEKEKSAAKNEENIKVADKLYNSGKFEEAFKKYNEVTPTNYVMNVLGYMNLFGKGTSPDPEKARDWFFRAAENGYGKAQYNLGLMYEVGHWKGVNKDIREAEKWYKEAANKGNSDAQYRLGALYEQGDGVIDKDIRKAKYWYNASADNGNTDAKNKLEKLNGN